MTDFANLADGGRRLGPLLSAALPAASDVILLPAIPNGVPVALGIVDEFAAPLRGLPVTRTEDGATVTPMPDLAGRTVVVVDDGVETGTVARSAATALRESGVGMLVLAVPVCPREAMSDLQHRYDLVVAVAKPMGRRDLSWHYADFDTIDEATALRLLRDHGSIS